MKKQLKDENKSLFSSKDIQQFRRLGQHLSAVKKQLNLYRHGATHLKLNRSCTVHDGIFSFTPAERKRLISLYEKKSKQYTLMKFVPASGAASRMFAEWFSALDKGGFDSSAIDKAFLRRLERYPFYFLIKQDKSAFQLIKQNNIKGLLEYILLAGGLNYGILPKALIPFHLYGEGNVRTALEEHLYEAAQYALGKGNTCNLHFTIPQEHRKEIIKKIKAVKFHYEDIFSIRYKISFSSQPSSTDIIAVDEENIPLRDKNGDIIFRPGGHGTLLHNLKKVNADFVFIRNIDNVAPQPLLGKILPYRKMIGGLAMDIQEEIFGHIRQLKRANIDDSNMKKIQTFCRKKLNINFPQMFINQSRKNKIKIILSLLNRPLRVCGVVGNKREPGGAPFWVEENDGTLTLQIVENAHVDKRKNEQVNIWSGAQYFNPVDMVCSIKDYQGRNFYLHNYVNHNSYTISYKNEKGLRIKSLETPGLWNGGMAYWNTVFVKLPLVVFNPVKTVGDLLRPEHLVS